MEVIRVRTTISADAGFLTANSSFMHIHYAKGQNVQQRFRSCSAPLDCSPKMGKFKFILCLSIASLKERETTLTKQTMFWIYFLPQHLRLASVTKYCTGIFSSKVRKYAVSYTPIKYERNNTSLTQALLINLPAL
jgi:hypothetical protein